MKYNFLLVINWESRPMDWCACALCWLNKILSLLKKFQYLQLSRFEKGVAALCIILTDKIADTWIKVHRRRRHHRCSRCWCCCCWWWWWCCCCCCNKDEFTRFLLMPDRECVHVFMTISTIYMLPPLLIVSHRTLLVRRDASRHNLPNALTGSTLQHV